MNKICFQLNNVNYGQNCLNLHQVLLLKLTFVLRIIAINNVFLSVLFQNQQFIALSSQLL